MSEFPLFFKGLNSPLYGWTTFFIHSRRLGYLHIFPVVNSAAVNMGVQREFFRILISILLDKYLFYPRSLGSKPTRHLPKETQLVSGSTWGEPSCRCHGAVRAERSSSPCGGQPRARGSRAASRAPWRGTRGCPGSEAPPSPAALLPTQVPLVKLNEMPESWPRCLVTVPSHQPGSRLSRALPGASSGDHGLWSLWAEVLLASHIMPSDDSSHGHRGNWLDP